jgi:hypothetical protein
VNERAASMTRTERIVAYTLALEALKHEQRIDEWLRANPGTVYWSHPTERGKRSCTVVRDNKILARSVGANDDDARAQVFMALFLKEDAAET